MGFLKIACVVLVISLLAAQYCVQAEEVAQSEGRKLGGSVEQGKWFSRPHGFWPWPRNGGGYYRGGGGGYYGGGGYNRGGGSGYYGGGGGGYRGGGPGGHH